MASAALDLDFVVNLRNINLIINHANCEELFQIH